MNLFQLTFKQMRQRALSTWLTLLSVLLGVALAVAILILQREGKGLFGQKDFGFDVLVGAKGSPTQLVMNTVYHIDRSPGNIPYSIYENLAAPRHPYVRTAIPYAVGDTYENHRIVATLPKIFGASEDGATVDPDRAMEYRPGQKLRVAEGRPFHASKFQAVIGADIPQRTKLAVGQKFQVTHGMPQPNAQPDIHEEQWEVVGVLERTNTALDRVIFIPLITYYAIGGHEEALEAQAAIRKGAALESFVTGRPPAATAQGHDDHAHDDHDHHGHSHAHEGKTYFLLEDGTIELKIPKEEWAVSAVLVRSRGAFQASSLMYQINNGPYAAAVNPAMTMREFFQVFLEPSGRVLTAIAWLVIVVAAVGILVSIYNSVTARRREVAILRALGATRAKVLTLICLEAALIGLIGGVLGLVAGHLLAGAGSSYLERTMGEGINWLSVGREEAIYLAGVVLIAVLAGLVPALKAYKTPVATNLVAG